MRYNRGMPIVACLADGECRFTDTQTALLVIDMQRDFFGPDGAALRPIIPRVAAVLAAARRAGLTLIHTREGYAADGHDVNPYKRHLGYVGR
ncbi:MAG: isochorismatase family protein, partial [Anaerolineales bacterium]|nr:isochorismatase family protein [Anaerolineales bacterium]